MFHSKRAAVVLCLALLASPCTHLAADPAKSSRLSEQLDAIFNKHEFSSRSPQMAWLNGGDSYTVIEPTSDGKGQEIAAYETESGKRSVLVSPAQLTPAGAKEPLPIWGYNWSGDKNKLLIFTNAKRVWREFTRGDYWILDLAAATPESRLIKLGGDAPESTLMFATFSPDSSRVAWVRENNLYVEELATRKVKQLTSDGSPDIINGTSDWVNEEELFLRDCFRWSPDSRFIAYWQFDQSGVSEYTLINDTDSQYPVVEKYKYPQPGTTNSAVRAGVVSVAWGTTQWIKLAGDPRQHYIAQMDWAGNSDGVLLEYLDRAQKTNQLIWADARNRRNRASLPKILTKPGSTFCPSTGSTKAIAQTGAFGKDFIFLSERDGWRHAWRARSRHRPAAPHHPLRRRHP